MSLVTDFLNLAQKKDVSFERKNIEHAILFVEEHSKGMKRKNGDSYVSHPIAIATVLLDVSPTEEMLIASLLADICGLEPTLLVEVEKQFGKSVTQLIQSVMKLAHIPAAGEDRQIESLRKMFVALAKDVRAVIIKLAGRIHNLETIDALPMPKRKEIARESLAIYAPVAGRLGIYALKGPLEDLSFDILQPAESEEIKKQMERHMVYSRRIMKNANKRLTDIFDQSKIPVTIKTRTKHSYGVYQKLQRKEHQSIEDIFDIFAVRIIVQDMPTCYAVLGHIHEHFVPLSRRFKDYIAVPKSNGYRSLHTTVVGLGGISHKSFPVEIQIRTKEMDLEAEIGVAAHWHYKQKGSRTKVQKSLPTGIIDQLQEMEAALLESNYFGQDANAAPPDERVYAVTPNGQIIDLPAGATPIDFAFAVHTDLGLSLRGAKINDKLVKLDTPLTSGEVVEIVTTTSAQPSTNWLSIAVTQRAQSQLKKYFRNQDKDALLRGGREMLNEVLVRHGSPPLDDTLGLLQSYGGRRRSKVQRETILVRIGNGSVSPSAVAKTILGDITLAAPKIEKDTPKIVKDAAEIIVSGERDLPIKLASCCAPTTTPDIIGYVTRGASVTIHAAGCATLLRLDERRFLPASFGYAQQRYVIEITRGEDRPGWLRDISAIFTELEFNIIDFDSRDEVVGVKKVQFTIECEKDRPLKKLLLRLKKIEAVSGVRAL